MSARILSGKEFAAKFKEDAAKRARALEAKYGVTPGLAVIIVGEDPASQVYVRNKDRASRELALYSEVIRLPETVTEETAARSALSAVDTAKATLGGSGAGKADPDPLHRPEGAAGGAGFPQYRQGHHGLDVD